MVISKYLFIVWIAMLFFTSSCMCQERPPRGATTGSAVSSSVKQVSEEQPKAKPIVNVYIENSASMDGYVKGVTEFETLVYDYLSTIEISKSAAELNLFYINSKIIKQSTDIEAFIKTLEPNTFKQKGGDRGTTDIANLIKMVLKETSGNTVSVVISDFIFSPGKGIKASEFLMNQQIGIKKIISTYLDSQQDAAVCIYQFFSKFEGYYYNREDKPIFIKSVRPFYMWVIGKKSQVKSLRENVDTKMANDIQQYCIFEGASSQLKYNIVSGKYVKTDKSDMHACYVEKDLNNKIAFSVNVDLSQSILGDSYLQDADNYTLSDPDMMIKSIERVQSTNAKYTHRINFVSNKIKSQTLSVALKSKMPMWVEAATDTEGLDINKANAMKQTYGLKYLINGVYEAFTFSGDTYFTINIKINK